MTEFEKFGCTLKVQHHDFISTGQILGKGNNESQLLSNKCLLQCFSYHKGSRIQILLLTPILQSQGEFKKFFQCCTGAEWRLARIWIQVYLTSKLLLWSHHMSDGPCWLVRTQWWWEAYEGSENVRWVTRVTQKLLLVCRCSLASQDRHLPGLRLRWACERKQGWQTQGLNWLSCTWEKTVGDTFVVDS